MGTKTFVTYFQKATICIRNFLMIVSLLVVILLVLPHLAHSFIEMTHRVNLGVEVGA